MFVQQLIAFHRFFAIGVFEGLCPLLYLALRSQVTLLCARNIWDGLPVPAIQDHRALLATATLTSCA